MPSLRTTAALVALLAPGLAPGGCYSAQLDPALAGVFACDPRDEGACPSGLSCVNERCEDDDTLPSLTILNPEEGQKGTTPALEEGPIPMDTDPIMFDVSFQGSNLELVAAGSDHVFGAGHVAIFIDGTEEALIESGTISALNSRRVPIPPRPGPHRITVQARRNDGLDYDNPEATATRLIWLENELAVGMRPFVAIRSPWPGDDFTLEDQEIEVRVMTLNVQLVEPNEGRREEAMGHAHIYYGDRFPECSTDPQCDSGYLGVAAAPDPGEMFSRTDVRLPLSGEETTTLTAVLRNLDHSIYEFPFGCGGGPLCRIAFDEIEIEREVE